MKKKVLIIVHHLCRGGAERSAASLSLHLASKYQVYLATFISEEYYPTTYDAAETRFCLNQAPGDNLWKSMLNLIARYRFIKGLKKEYDIDVSISFLRSADIINTITKGRENTVISIRTSIHALLQGRISSWIYMYILRRADNVIVQNTVNRNILEAKDESFRSKMRLVPNSYNIRNIIEKSQEDVKVLSSGEKILLNVGRFYSVKGQKYLFRILKELLIEGHKLKLILLGEGELKSDYINFCSELGLRTVVYKSDCPLIDLNEGDVFFLGFASNPYKYYKFCNIFTFSSLHEGFPNALAEAMICGTCVVSTDCEVGPRGLISTESKGETLYPIESDRGILLPVFENYEIASDALLTTVEKLWIGTLSKLLNSNQGGIEMGKCAARWMLRFDEKIVMKEWEKVVDDRSGS